ncbi:T9SS type A sorting domain-containing protein [Aquimarina algiphila]|nr:T9SS type A sorting domain-containing protein [Aquimarina algiphila]
MMLLTIAKGDINPTPTISGVTGGVFSSTAGLSINSTTGEIDIAASIAGSYTVTYTTTGSCPDSSDVVVIITDLDDATFTYENSAYCADATNPVPNVTGITGGTFSSTLGLIIDSNSGEINLVESTPGIYTITYTTSGICSNSSTADITINALPDATVTENSLTFTADTTGATYQWINCETNQPISGETSISFTATENGSYAVDITLNGCTNRSSCILVDSIVLQQEDTISNFKLYPNPTDGIINVTIPVQKISIFNYYGRKVFEASTSTFDISSLRSGIYFMEVETGNGRTTRKIVRQ